MQFKSFHFLFSHVGCRGFCEPEHSHPLWNATKRALRECDLDLAVMKLTIVCNFGHGAFCTGDRLLSRQEYLHKYLQKQDAAYFQEIAFEIARDNDEHHLVVDEDHAASLIEDFMNAPSIKNRGLFAPGLQFVARFFQLKRFQKFRKRLLFRSTV